MMINYLLFMGILLIIMMKIILIYQSLISHLIYLKLNLNMILIHLPFIHHLVIFHTIKFTI